MKATYTRTIDIDLNRIASALDDTLYDILTSDYDLDKDSVYQVFPQIFDELWAKVKEQYKEEVK